MEKITDEELKKMLTEDKEASKEDNVIRNEETGEVQWVKSEGPIKLDDENLQDSLEQEIDFNTIPENVEGSYEEQPLDPILEQRHELSIGMNLDDVKDIFKYVSGDGEKPIIVDRFTSDVEGRLKDMTLMMSLYQLQQIPMLIALRNQVQERLFSPENLYDMDSKTLSATMTNLNKDIQNIIDGANKSVQTALQYGSLNSKYRKILDNILQLPADKLNILEDELLKDIKID